MKNKTQKTINYYNTLPMEEKIRRARKVLSFLEYALSLESLSKDHPFIKNRMAIQKSLLERLENGENLSGEDYFKAFELGE